MQISRYDFTFKPPSKNILSKRSGASKHGRTGKKCIGHEWKVPNHCGKINPQCLNCWTFSLSGGGDDDDNRVVCVLAHNKKWYTKASSSVVVCVLLKTFSEANFHAFLWGWLRTTLNDVPRYFSSSFALSQSSWNNFFLSWQWIFCFKQQKWLNRNFSFAPYTASICMCVCLNNFENLRKNICIMTSHPCDNKVEKNYKYN